MDISSSSYHHHIRLTSVTPNTHRMSSGSVVVWLRDGSGDQRVIGSIPETTDFLTNSSGQATNALVSLFTKQ